MTIYFDTNTATIMYTSIESIHIDSRAPDDLQLVITTKSGGIHNLSVDSEAKYLEIKNAIFDEIKRCT